MSLRYYDVLEATLLEMERRRHDDATTKQEAVDWLRERMLQLMRHVVATPMIGVAFAFPGDLDMSALIAAGKESGDLCCDESTTASSTTTTARGSSSTLRYFDVLEKTLQQLKGWEARADVSKQDVMDSMRERLLQLMRHVVATPMIGAAYAFPGDLDLSALIAAGKSEAV